ncbi:MAG TPA: YceI family protein [Aequorivita sp.]|nr:YceI family protein [Aequorivita sp.]
MKTLAYPLLFLLLVSFTNTSTVNKHKTIFISPKSELEIVGSTNVSTFTCLFNVKNLNKPLRIDYWEGDDLIRFQKSTLVLDNTFFDCGGKGINKDFHDLLKTKVYPQILLTLKEIKKKAIADNKVEALVEIQIAGISRSYIVDVEAKQEGDLHLNGNLKLNITDFNLEAPKKILGLIVVSEEIEIIFKLIVGEEKG